jgi:hypothetical protein
VPARRGSWDELSPRTRARWTGAFGGGSRDVARREDRARAAYERGERISRSQAGHEPAAVREGRAASAFFGPDAEYRVVERLTKAEARRLGRVDALVGQLVTRDIEPEEFERRSSRWRPFRGERLTSDPRAVLGRIEQRRAGDLDLFEYRSGRAT